MNGDIKIGKLLCDEDIITKRQLNKALQVQVKGDKRTLGEILVDMGFCDFDDITNALLNNDSDTQKHEEKHQEIHQEPIELKPEVKDIPPVKKPKKKKPIELSEDKELPKIDIEKIFTDEYPSKPDGHNWPRSYEQYKNQVGGLQEDMDAVYDVLDEYEELIKELQKDIKDLERRKRDK
jgi:hypothetical protein